jgi:6-pyruvoyltetrahydropterin/6-carboxytetrahydropterin synthase
MKARLTKDFVLEAAQFLPKAPEGHKCRLMHGHTFKIEITVEGVVDPETGWVYDHARISAAMKPIIQQLDHSVLNDMPGLENPTIELMADWLWKKLEPQLPGLAEIVIHETPFARCSYRGE